VFRWVDHTAELELEIEAPTEEGVFADALAALAELLASEEELESGMEPERESGPESEREPGGKSQREPLVRRHVSVEAEDRPALLAEWMEELVFLAETEGFEPRAVETLELGPRWAHVAVTGRLGQPPPLVKAVTYHRLSFVAGDDGYRATVVLDV
jgi:SHS2 domain-containing protein